MMAAGANPSEWLSRARSGDRAALQQLLLSLHDRASAAISGRLPADLSGLLSADDVLQEAYIVVCREIGTFEGSEFDAFVSWVIRVAEHRMLDMIKGLRARKRGGKRRAIDVSPKGDDQATINLLEMLSVHSRTPSRSVARREDVSLVQSALASLETDYRECLTLRYVEGLGIEEIAERVGKTSGAARMLCHRGLQRLREAIERLRGGEAGSHKADTRD
ncbi:RNA polymerase sigma factor SigX [Phycisphaerae bacterium RAS1]|nr:RNA polymerase sigma factor SigX [Phycisphaerae bacterium RAS1]